MGTETRYMVMKKIQHDLMHGKYTITEVIDAYIELNGIIGVGLVTLAEQLQEYVMKRCRNEKTIV